MGLSPWIRSAIASFVSLQVGLFFGVGFKLPLTFEDFERIRPRGPYYAFGAPGSPYRDSAADYVLDVLAWFFYR